MAIQFCDNCGDTLPISADSSVKCDCCETLNKNILLSTTITSTTSNFPSELRQKLTSTTQVLTAKDKQGAFQLTNEKCPVCQQQELSFSQAQLRGADEGTTIFYFCLGCGHRFTANN